MLNLTIPIHEADLIPLSLRVGPTLIYIVYFVLGASCYRSYIKYRELQKRRQWLTEGEFDKRFKWFLIKHVSIFTGFVLLLILMIYQL